jgi:hypothetical protein
LVKAVLEPGYSVVVEHKDIPKPKSWKRNKHTFFVYRKRFAGHASETTEVMTHPLLQTVASHARYPLTQCPTQCDLRLWPAFFIWKKNVEVVLRKLTEDTPETVPAPRQTGVPPTSIAAGFPDIPAEVQALLMLEGATVTDLDMDDDPLGFDSDEAGNYAPLPSNHAVHHRPALTPDPTVLSPSPTIPVLPVLANGTPDTTSTEPPPVTADPTPPEPPPVTPAARNATATITHLQAQVPHDAKRAAKTALKKHNQAVDRTYNAAVKKRRTELCLDLGASIVTPDVRKPPTRGTKRKCTTRVMPAPPTMHPLTPPVPPPRIPVPGEVCAHGSTWLDLLQLDHVRYHSHPGQYLHGKHCIQCQTPIANVVAKKPLVYYCTHDFRAYNLDSADASLTPCHVVVCPTCYVSAMDDCGTSRRRRRS